jgi:hypothetical protein
MNNNLNLIDFSDKYKNKNFIVLGCGVSVNDIMEYKDIINEKFITIGVNDICELFTPYFLLCVDKIHKFTEYRQNVILNSKPKYFLTHLTNHWNLHNNVDNIIFKLGKSDLVSYKYGTPKKLCIDYSNNSPYMACLIAFVLGAKNIGLIGVDFTDNHFNNNDGTHVLSSKLDIINSDYLKLKNMMLKYSCNLYNISDISKLQSLHKMKLINFLNLNKNE